MTRQRGIGRLEKAPSEDGGLKWTLSKEKSQERKITLGSRGDHVRH